MPLAGLAVPAAGEVISDALRYSRERMSASNTSGDLVLFCIRVGAFC